MIKEIGGYFEQAAWEEINTFPHKDGILLNTGRNALEFILRSLKDVKRIYLPYFTCGVVLEPIKKLHLPYEFYHINSNFELADNIALKECEYIIVNNYFGIKDRYILSLYPEYGEHLIVDCAQAFFAPAEPGIKSFYSARKFVGVADGGIAYPGCEKCEDLTSYDEELTERHSDHLIIRKMQGAEAGFKKYQHNESLLNNQPIRRMSRITKNALFHIDYVNVKKQRLKNWSILNEALSYANLISVPLLSEFECPLFYPYVVDNGLEVRNRLISEKVFVAKYWPDVVWNMDFEFEADLSDKIVAVPLDQRYCEEDMEKIIKIIFNK